MEDARPTSMTLLDRVRADDQEAWNRLIHLYAPLVRYWCRRGGVAEGELDDVTQEVFRAVASSIGDFRRDRAGDRFRGWLRGVTRNKVLDWHRARGRRPAEAEGGTAAGRALQQHPEPPAETDPIDDPDERRELDGVYRRALGLVRSEFEGKTWDAFWRVTVEGHATADVAAALGVSTAAVRQAKSRVLRRLRQEVGDLIA